MRRVEFLIAGFGPCGIGAALELQKRGCDYLVFDEREEPGGWAASRSTPEGFVFDFGGHVLFPHKHYPSFAKVLDELPLSWDASVPKRGVHHEGSFLPYPAQRNLQRLPPGRLVMALASLAWKRVCRQENKYGEAADLQSYLLSQFGEYLTRTLMEPLNSKMWAHATHTLSKGWVTLRSGSAQRNVPTVSLRQTLRNVLTHSDAPGWTSDTFVTYPSAGGSGAIWSTLAARIPSSRLWLGRRLVSLELGAKIATLDNGERIQFGSLISSVPLDTLLRTVRGNEDLEGQCEALASRFVFARSRLFGFGVEGELAARFEGLHSFHVPAAELPFWRVTFPSNVSRGNVPRGTSPSFSVLCEISEPAARAAEPEQMLRARVLEGLRSLGVLGPGQEIVSTFSERIEHGYPVPFLGRDALLAEVRALLEPAGVYGRGRFGAWKYEISNQDHAFMQGVELVGRLTEGTPEETFVDPYEVNEQQGYRELAAVAEGELEASFAPRWTEAFAPVTGKLHA